ALASRAKLQRRPGGASTPRARHRVAHPRCPPIVAQRDGTALRARRLRVRATGGATMDEGMAGPAAAGGEGPDGVQVLAALRRAMLHRRPRRGPAPLWLLLEHLAIPRRSAAARRVRVLLGELERDGLIRPGREHGLTVWSVTDAGERRLLTGSEPQLPESPRRRRRRSARTAAARELPRFRARLAGTLAEAAAMLDADADAEGALAPGLAEAPCDGEEAAGKGAVPGA